MGFNLGRIVPLAGDIRQNQAGLGFLILATSLLISSYAAATGKNPGTSPAAANRGEGRWIEMDRRVADLLPQGLFEVHGLMPASDNGEAGRVLGWLPFESLELLSQSVHEKTGRCGGWVDVTGEDSVLLQRVKARNEKGVAVLGDKPKLDLPLVRQVDPSVEAAVQQVQPRNLAGFIGTYSQKFKTRSAKGKSGAQVSEFLQKEWNNLVQRFGRTDIAVELVYPPAGYSQPNVRVRIPGADPSASRVVLGGHLDSISYSDRGAPGADDDASGISALTEVLRVLLETRVRPARTIEIIGYAAEELGLLGSRSFAEAYRKENVAVRGALQLDMVGYPGPGDGAMVFIVDHVSSELTTWTKDLAQLYVGGVIAEDQCGYACSDHASWERYGYPSAFPFEARFDTMNQRIHTPDDVLDGVLDADHAAKFAKLGVAFALHLSR